MLISCVIVSSAVSYNYYRRGFFRDKEGSFDSLHFLGVAGLSFVILGPLFAVLVTSLGAWVWVAIILIILHAERDK